MFHPPLPFPKIFQMLSGCSQGLRLALISLLQGANFLFSGPTQGVRNFVGAFVPAFRPKPKGPKA